MAMFERLRRVWLYFRQLMQTHTRELYHRKQKCQDHEVTDKDRGSQGAWERSGKGIGRGKNAPQKALLLFISFSNSAIPAS